MTDDHNTKNDGFTVRPFAMTDSQSPQKKLNHKSMVSLNNVHTKTPKWCRALYTDERNKSKTPKANNLTNKNNKTKTKTKTNKKKERKKERRQSSSLKLHSEVV